MPARRSYTSPRRIERDDVGPTTQLADRTEPDTLGETPPQQGSPPSERWPILLAVGATVIAIVLNVHDIGDKSFWFDEGATVGLVDRPYGDFLWRAAHWELNQSAYYLAFSGWFEMGRSEAFLRLLSAAFVVATVPALFALGRRLFDARVGAVAALLLAVHSFAIQWGQQLRAYSMVMLLVTLATLALVNAIDRPGATGPAVLYGVVGAVAVYAHFFAGLVILAHAVALLLVRPFPRRLAIVGGATMAVLIAPAVSYFLRRQGDPLGWVGGEGGDSLADVLEQLAGGRFRHFALYALAAATGIALAVWAARRQRPPVDWWRAALPCLWLLLPLVIVVVSTETVKDLLVARFLIVVVPALALTAAVAVCRLPWPAIGGVLLGGLLVLSLDGVDGWYRATAYEDWRDAVAMVGEQAGPEDSLIVVPASSTHVVDYYQRRSPGPDFDFETPEADDPPAGERLWVIERLSQVGRELSYDFALLPWLRRHYELVDEELFPNVVVRQFRRR